LDFILQTSPMPFSLSHQITWSQAQHVTYDMNLEYLCLVQWISFNEVVFILINFWFFCLNCFCLCLLIIVHSMDSIQCVFTTWLWYERICILEEKQMNKPRTLLKEFPVLWGRDSCTNKVHRAKWTESVSGCW
jgi:hypothetical protein